jgi:resuscitation-promoting factor RpfB
MRKVALGAALFVAAAIPAFLGQKASAEATQKPDSKPKMVVVKQGDSLSKIARRHHTTYPRLFYANKNVKHPDRIYPDEKLRIPRADEKLKKRPLPSDAQVPEEPAPERRQASESSPEWQGRWHTQTQAVPAHAVSGSAWDRLAACESGGNWSINTGNGYYGGLQFSLSTWRAVGGSGYPHQASKAEQIRRGQILQARSGWGQWPACAARLGLF